MKALRTAVSILVSSSFLQECVLGFRIIPGSILHNYYHLLKGNNNEKHGNLRHTFQSTFKLCGGAIEDDTITIDKGIHNSNAIDDHDEEMIVPQYSLPRNDNYEQVLVSPSPFCTKGLIIMDGFCPYHSGYLSHQAKVAYNAGIVHTLSDYVAKCLMKKDDDDGDDTYANEEEDDQNDYYANARIPKLKRNLDKWLASIPFDIQGIICESDSGLDDAEKLGVAIGLYPDKHDGYNSK